MGLAQTYVCMIKASSCNHQDNPERTGRSQNHKENSLFSSVLYLGPYRAHDYKILDKSHYNLRALGETNVTAPE